MYVCASKASVQQSRGQSFYVKIPIIEQKQGKKRRADAVPWDKLTARHTGGRDKVGNRDTPYNQKQRCYIRPVILMSKQICTHTYVYA